MNNEICAAVEAKIEGNLHYFDATRRYIQFGRYINHSTAPNIRPHPPIFIRGKYHLGFTSTVDIPSGDELVWDYIFRDKEIPWLGKSNEDKAIFTLMIFTSTPTAKPKRTLKQIEMEREECNPEDMNNEEETEDYSPPNKRIKVRF